VRFLPFEISRTYPAPRDKVWQAWTEPARLKHWWGPRGFTVHTCKVDLRPGGTFLYGMHAPDGSDMWGKFVYREIKAPEKLVFVVSFSDPHGGVTRHPWNAGWPKYILSTVTFTESAGKTTVAISWIPHDASDEERKVFEEGRASMTQGWGGTLDQLEAFLGGKTNQRTVNLTRVFDAPRNRVFDCWTRAEHLSHWFGPKGFTIHSAQTDPRPGGLFKLCMRAPDGADYWVRGEFRELDEPKHLIIACAADDEQGVERLHEVIDVTFTESAGRTTVSLKATASGPSDEAAAMLRGMEKGWAQTVDRLGIHLQGK
jgi:uncharacterized protein YndB with AHSA1/START domain